MSIDTLLLQMAIVAAMMKLKHVIALVIGLVTPNLLKYGTTYNCDMHVIHTGLFFFFLK